MLLGAPALMEINQPFPFSLSALLASSACRAKVPLAGRRRARNKELPCRNIVLQIVASLRLSRRSMAKADRGVRFLLRDQRSRPQLNQCRLKACGPADRNVCIAAIRQSLALLISPFKFQVSGRHSFYHSKKLSELFRCQSGVFGDAPHR